MTGRPSRLLLAMALTVALTGGCGSNDERLTVFAASSLADVLPDLADAHRQAGGPEKLPQRLLAQGLQLLARHGSTWKTLPLPQLPLVLLSPLLIVALLLVSLCVLCVRSGAPRRGTHVRRPLAPKRRC